VAAAVGDVELVGDQLIDGASTAPTHLSCARPTCPHHHDPWLDGRTLRYEYA
jgi:hypothetical protein